MSDKNILIISAHPDDHIHIAGSIMYFQDRGYSVYEILMTEGENGALYKDKKYEKISHIHKLRLIEYQKAAKFLGIRHSYFLGEADGMIQANDKSILKVVSIIRNLKPYIAITHSDYDTHRDHIETYKIALQAVQISATTAYLEDSQTVWRVPVFWKFEGYMPETSNIYIDISPYRRRKEELIGIYSSQKSRHIIQYIESSDRRNGIVIGTDYAESVALDKVWPVDLRFLVK